MKIICNACSAISEFPDKVGFRDICSSCDAYLHSCENCGLYEKGHCTEPSAEKVSDPEGMNFCEWYQARAQGAGRSVQEDQGRDAAEEMWKKLIKQKEE